MDTRVKGALLNIVNMLEGANNAIFERNGGVYSETEKLLMDRNVKAINDAKELLKIASVENEPKYWTYAIGGDDECDAEFNSMEDAFRSAEDNFEEKCANDDMKTSREEDVEIMEFAYGEDGEKVVTQRIKGVVSYVYYHGDQKEHGQWN